MENKTGKTNYRMENQMSTDTQNDVRYPDVEVNLFEIDGNAFSIMGAVTKALRRGGVDKLP